MTTPLARLHKEVAKLAESLTAAGFIRNTDSYFYDNYNYKLLSDSYELFVTLHSSDNIESLCARVMDYGWRTRSINKTTRREIFALADRVRKHYETNFSLDK
jgi:hypothetical protein